VSDSDGDIDVSRHLIFGAGLTGGYLAGCMMQAGLKPTLLARPATMQAMQAGLQISDFIGNSKSLPAPIFAHPKCATKTYEFVWLTIKCTAIQSSLESIKKFITPNSIIICCQNGLGSEKIVAAAFMQNTVLRAIIGFNVVEVKPGHLHRSTLGELVFEADEKIMLVARQLKTDLLPLHISEDIVADQWAKLQLNLANALNALADIPLKEMLEDRDYRRIMASLMDELLLVTNKLDIQLPRLTALPARWFPKLLRLPNWLFQMLAKQMLAIDPSARLSMWWDLSRGKKTEISYINDALVKQAAQLGLACPVNEKLVQLIHQVELGEQKIGLSAEFLNKQFNG